MKYGDLYNYNLKHYLNIKDFVEPIHRHGAFMSNIKKEDMYSNHSINNTNQLEKRSNPYETWTDKTVTIIEPASKHDNVTHRT